MSDIHDQMYHLRIQRDAARRVIVKIQAEADRLREALRFYADPKTYEEGAPPPAHLSGFVAIEQDRGAVARAALDAEDGDE